MARSTDRSTFKREAERTFPHRVDIRVPEGGLGKRIDAMQGWCRERLTVGTWAMHGHTEKRKGAMAIDYLRFYFASEADAEAFRKLWGE
jgi:hypothetical protein